MLVVALTRLAVAHNTDRVTSAAAPNAAVIPLPEHLLPPITFGSKQKPFFLLRKGGRSRQAALRAGGAVRRRRGGPGAGGGQGRQHRRSRAV